MKDTLGVGMVGYGFIGKVHTYAYLNMPLFYDPVPCRTKLVGVCTAHEKTAQKAREQGGYEVATTDYRDLLDREDIHIIDVCTPNVSHRDILVNALRAGKHVYCDKPLAMNRREAEEIWKAAQEAGTKGQMAFEYRFVPAVMKARELVARVKAVLRRTKLRDGKPRPPFETRELVVDFKSHRVTLSGKEIELTATEYRILSYLAQNAGRVVVPDQILEKVWGKEYQGEAHLLQVNIARLRKKVGDDIRNPKYISTRPGIGYIMMKQP